MCGIVFRLNQQYSAIPEIFEGGEQLDDFYRWQSTDGKWNQELIDDNHAVETAKTSRIERKLETVSYERILHEQLGKAKNVIAKDEESKKILEDQINSLNSQIAKLNVELEQTPAKLSLKFLWSDLVPHIAARGPNCILYWALSTPGLPNAELFSSVLSFRQPFLPQPVQIPNYQNLILHFYRYL